MSEAVADHRHPERIESVEQLEDLLSEPTPRVIDTLARLDGDVLVLGVGGKMGPTLARMAVRASAWAGVARRVIGVSRFSEPGLEARLQAHGVETLRADLLNERQLRELPDAANVVFMGGMKFGSTGQQALTWAQNAFLPGLVCQRFAASRIVAFSSGNVYPFTPIALGGARETDDVAPVGEYAMSVVGRERIFEHFSRTLGIPLAIVRLNYAVELRYGVLVDLARKVAADEPVDLAMGALNAIWQGDANAASLAAFDRAATPPFVFNLAGPETLSVRRVAEQFGRLLHKPVTFVGSESSDALLSNGQLGHRLFGYPRTSIGQVVEWTAEWVRRGGASLNKPTHFETRDGKF